MPKFSVRTQGVRATTCTNSKAVGFNVGVQGIGLHCTLGPGEEHGLGLLGTKTLTCFVTLQTEPGQSCQKACKGSAAKRGVLNVGWV